MKRVDSEIVRRFVAIGVGLLLFLLASLPTASAQQLATTRDCVSTDDARDFDPAGTGFFDAGLTSVSVRSGHADQSAVVDTTRQVAITLAGYFDGTDIRVYLNERTESTRQVVIDGDIAVPNQPAAFTVGAKPTLYLHWTTATADLASLLTAPASPPLTCRASEVLWPSAAGILAYRDDTPEVSGPVGLVDGISTLAQWPVAAGAAAAVALAGGGLAARRRKGMRDEEVDEPGRARFDNRMTEIAHLMRSARVDKRMTEIASLLRAARPLAHPRVIFLDDDSLSDETPQPRTQREIDLGGTVDASALTKLMEKVSSKSTGPVLSREDFVQAANAEWSRRTKGGADGAIASLVLSELDAVRLRLGARAAQTLFDEVAQAITELIRPLDALGLANDDELAILMPEVDEAGARDLLDQISKKIAATTFTVAGERVLLTPATGFAMLSDTDSAPELIRAVETARSLSMMNLHLDPERWDAEVPVHGPATASASRWASVKKKLRTPMQIAITIIIAWVIPFAIYVGLDAVGADISFFVYLFVVATLVITGGFILAEGFMALKQKEPPEFPSRPYPKATALIAAYMPNEAATVIETIDAFLAIDYPNELQIILAYNTPDPLPVEEHLDQIAAKHPNFVPIRIVGSNSKAQNVNAALSMAEGEFIGMFDADHQPRPDAFTRAWRWIDDGYDVVQGHCLTRNGDAGWLAKMIAVEFESIYAVAHPGRAKMHRFGVFGGSNGFWRTELLHETRMRGSMLTEDIDSSMRVVERGFKIRSDRDLVSRELATTTFQQVWNQRMRWAQGWFQVSLEHVKFAFKAKELSVRQKLGVFHLLMWREGYPWLSQQLFPLIAFWAYRAGGFEKLNWTVPIFVATSIFTFSVGPLQTAFAYKLADPEIKQHKSWFWGYLLFTTPFYTEYKNLIARVAHVKQFMGESDWRVTPRSEDPVSMPDQ